MGGLSSQVPPLCRPVHRRVQLQVRRCPPAVVRVPFTWPQQKVSYWMISGRLHAKAEIEETDDVFATFARRALHFSRGSISSLSSSAEATEAAEAAEAASRRSSADAEYMHHGRALGALSVDAAEATWEALHGKRAYPSFELQEDQTFRVQLGGKGRHSRGRQPEGFKNFSCPLFESALVQVQGIVDGPSLSRCVVYSSFEWVAQHFSVFLQATVARGGGSGAARSSRIEIRCLHRDHHTDVARSTLRWFNEAAAAVRRRVLILHQVFAESININAPSGLVILEPLDSAAKTQQLHARILRYSAQRQESPGRAREAALHDDP